MPLISNYNTNVIELVINNVYNYIYIYIYIHIYPYMCIHTVNILLDLISWWWITNHTWWFIRDTMCISWDTLLESTIRDLRPGVTKPDNSKSIIVDKFPNETSIYRGFSFAILITRVNIRTPAKFLIPATFQDSSNWDSDVLWTLKNW